MTGSYPYLQGYAAGDGWAKDVVKTMNAAVHEPTGDLHDMLQKAVEGFVPDDIIESILERVPVPEQNEFGHGFRAGVAAYLDREADDD